VSMIAWYLHQTTRLFKRFDSTLCSSPLETRSKRLYWSSSSTFVCMICLHLSKHVRNLSLYRVRPVLCLHVLKFSPTLASRAALSAVPARHASTFQPCFGYSVHAEAEIDILKACERYTKYAVFTRRKHAGTKWYTPSIFTLSLFPDLDYNPFPPILTSVLT
jgi:hypothetical protein